MPAWTPPRRSTAAWTQHWWTEPTEYRNKLTEESAERIGAFLFCEKCICAEVQAFHRFFRTVGVEKVENKRQIIKQGGFFGFFAGFFPYRMWKTMCKVGKTSTEWVELSNSPA